MSINIIIEPPSNLLTLTTLHVPATVFAFPPPHSTLIVGYNETAFIWEQHNCPFSNLPILMFWTEAQLEWTMTWSQNNTFCLLAVTRSIRSMCLTVCSLILWHTRSQRYSWSHLAVVSFYGLRLTAFMDPLSIWMASLCMGWFSSTWTAVTTPSRTKKHIPASSTADKNQITSIFTSSFCFCRNY